MEQRPKGYGLSSEVREKIAAKYDEREELEVRSWMEMVAGPVHPDVPPGEPLGLDRLHEALKDGVYLCRLAQKLTNDKVMYGDSKMAFKQMQNIGNFLEAMEKFGVKKVNLFQTVDLFEKTNMWAVVCAIQAVGRMANTKGSGLPHFGPEESTINTRDFSEEQLKVVKNMDCGYAPEYEETVRTWMEEVTETELGQPFGADGLHAALKDGIYLCRLAEIITGEKLKIRKPTNNFNQIENIGDFLKAMRRFGLQPLEIFVAMDLFEKQQMGQVISTIFALGRKCNATRDDLPHFGSQEYM